MLDREIAREALAHVLRAAGYEVSLIHDITTALRVISGGCCSDALIANLSMFDALDVVHIFESNHRSRPVILRSGSDDARSRVAQLPASCQITLLAKPSPPTAVLEVMQRLLPSAAPSHVQDAIAAD